MNYTANHHLPQWASSDRVRMEDFNQMNKDLETSLDAAVSKADAAQSTAAAAKSSAISAQSAAASAQSVASAAKIAAATAQTTANNAYSPSNKPFVTGSYTGGTSATVVQLPFWPSFLIISGMMPTRSASTSDFSQFDRYFVMVSGTQMNDRVQLHTLGFTAYPRPSNGAHYPDLNEPGRTYDYIAFK